MQILKQATAVDVVIGPFVDSGDGYTAEVGLSPAVELSKNGQGFAAKSNVTTPVYDDLGYYNCELDATDTGTVGTLVLAVAGSATALAVRHEYQVIEEAVYDAMYGASAAGPLQSTTAGRTLDVTATGAAGIDWANVENPTTALDLSATDIQLADTVTTVTNQVTAEANADAVWDELLSGATHNIATSAGRRLRNIQDFGIYDLARVWVDEVAGTSTGTTDGEDATVTNRADDLDNALTIAASVGLDEVGIQAGNSITLTAALAGYKVYAREATIALGGQSLAGTRIIGATISGIFTGTPVFVDCIVSGTLQGPGATLIDCRFLGATIENIIGGDWLIHNGRGETAGSSASLTFDFNSQVNEDCSLRNYSGGIQIEGMVVENEMTIEGFGSITEGTCTAGSPQVRGVFNFASITNLTPNYEAAINKTTIGDSAWDETLADHLGAGSTGNALNAAGAAGDPWTTALPGAYGAGTAGKIVGDNIDAPLSTIDTVVDTIAVDVAGLDGDAMRGTDSAALATVCTEGRLAELDAANLPADVDAILADTGELQSDDVPTLIAALPTAVENADGLLDRDMSTGVDSGSTTVRTPRQALRFLRNKWAIAGTTLTVNKEDDATASWTGTVSTDAAADPVTGNNPAGGS